MIFSFSKNFLRLFNFLFLWVYIKDSKYLLFKRGLRLFKGLCLLLLPNVLGGTFIPDSRVLQWWLDQTNNKKVQDSFKCLYYLGYITLKRLWVYKSSHKMFVPNHGLLLNFWNCRVLLSWSIHLWNWWYFKIKKLEDVVYFFWS